MFAKYSFVLFNLLFGIAFGREPQCSSFHYEEKMLEKMIRAEIKVEEMMRQIQNVEDKLNASLDEISAMTRNSDANLERKTEILKREIDDTNASIERLNNKTNNAEKTQGRELVAFNAYEAADLDLAKDEIIIFQKTLLNMGDSYNNKTGKFTAPVSGLYLFSVYLCSLTSRTLNFPIVKQGTDILRVLTHYDGNKSCGSGSVVAFLDVGETVWVRSTSTVSNQLYQDTYWRNTFTGVLIQNA